MSSLASLFNSSAALFTVDIYEKLRPGRSEKHLLTVGRVATAVVVVLGILWIPVMKVVSGGGLYQYLQSVQGYLAPPITAVFLLGLFYKRLNATGAVWALGGGFILGMAKLTCQVFFGQGKIENPAWLAAVGDFNFLYATGILFVAASALMIIGSLLTEAPPSAKTEGLTYRSIRELHGDEIRASWDTGNKLLAGLILVFVSGLYLYFSFWVS
jgi:SSS family solute:Na+ symporter